MLIVSNISIILILVLNIKGIAVAAAVAAGMKTDAKAISATANNLP